MGLSLIMLNLNQISLIILTLILLTILLFSYLDYRKKRVLLKKPFVSFIVPCFNDGKTIADTLKSIYDSYDSDKLEIIVINDCSTDDSSTILNKLKKKFSLKIVTNKVNLGKAKSINNNYNVAKSEYLFFVDADVILNEKAVCDLIARLGVTRVAGVSCPYRALNKGFLATMQNLEYNMLSFIQNSYNFWSTFSLWGGCFAVKKKALVKVNGLSENMLTEDMDLAFKLIEAGYKVEQSVVPILTYVPDNVKWWYHQKLRWTGGGIQCYLKHFKIWIKFPLHVIFTVLYSVLSIIFLMSIFRQITFYDNIVDNFTLLINATTFVFSLKAIGLSYGGQIIKNFLSMVYYSAFAIPYVIPLMHKFKDIYKILYVLPFSIIYYPIFSLISIMGFVKGILAFRKMKKNERAW